ncbi:hypothetical protein [Actinoplanes sp. N902-109]|uniref:hypothetical protein n=1 Tax=Actinoplanes sp. (strain N902-109) TaxID=649831 RepID=UPI0003294A65|nr:hypothetical protein [Actinoplanes sp. N902-109]AGL13897.1 hypothetical protein L083_0387 [Actinoplanes sp. N902-109]
MTQSTNSSSAARGFLTPAAPLTDNVALIEWFEGSRRVLHTGALELGIVAAEIDAKLRKVSRGLVVTGMTAGYRAGRVAKPIGQAAEALVVASRYIITASNRFEAVYMPELQAAGYQQKPSGFGFKANP